jgi:hypothetical protein
VVLLPSLLRLVYERRARSVAAEAQVA